MTLSRPRADADGLAVSADGRRIAVARDFALWRITLRGASPSPPVSLRDRGQVTNVMRDDAGCVPDAPRPAQPLRGRVVRDGAAVADAEVAFVPGTSRKAEMGAWTVSPPPADAPRARTAARGRFASSPLADARWAVLVRVGRGWYGCGVLRPFAGDLDFACEVR